jgi:hypothetical protein
LEIQWQRRSQFIYERRKWLMRQVSSLARRILPAAISRRAMTMARLSDTKSGFAPFKSCFALFAARITSSKRLGISDKQSSTVILAMPSMLSRRVMLNKSSIRKHGPFGSKALGQPRQLSRSGT